CAAAGRTTTSMPIHIHKRARPNFAVLPVSRELGSNLVIIFPSAQVSHQNAIRDLYLIATLLNGLGNEAALYSGPFLNILSETVTWEELVHSSALSFLTVKYMTWTVSSCNLV